jgi:endonuclease
MRLVIATCTVDYAGRLSTRLPLATRLLIVKADGSVLIHSDGGGYKPLNWMAAPCTLREEPDRWLVTNRTGESMTIVLHQVLHDSSHQLGLDPGLVKDGVERHLQELLADRCEVLGDGWSLVRREYRTDIGPVDLLCKDDQGDYVAVEIKRRGEIEGVEQLSRYLERLQLGIEGVRGVFAALAFAPQARVLASTRGIQCVQLDYDALRGLEPTTPRLF